MVQKDLAVIIFKNYSVLKNKTDRKSMCDYVFLIMKILKIVKYFYSFQKQFLKIRYRIAILKCHDEYELIIFLYEASKCLLKIKKIIVYIILKNTKNSFFKKNLLRG